MLYEDISKAPCRALFNPSLASIKLWKLVQIHRTVEDQIKTERGNRQGREAMLPVHGNRFLARQVFRYLALGNIDDSKKDIQALLSLVPEVTIRAIHLTARAITEKYPESYLANLFKNTKKCKELENLVDTYWC